MLVSRVGAAAMRPGAFAPLNLMRSASPMLSLGAQSFQSSASLRSAPTSKITKVSADKGHEILTNQRLNRPISPHLEVYRISQTYLGSSAWMRLTGCTVLGIGYVYFSAYLFAPLLGYELGSASLVSAFASMPYAVKTGVKLALAWPFTFHFVNGIKQLLYDSGWAYPYNKVTMSRNDGYVFAIATTIALGLVFGF